MNSVQYEKAKLLEGRISQLRDEYSKMERLHRISVGQNWPGLFFSGYDNASGRSVGATMFGGMATEILNYGMQLIQRELAEIVTEFNSLVTPVQSDESGQQSG